MYKWHNVNDRLPDAHVLVAASTSPYAEINADDVRVAYCMPGDYTEESIWYLYDAKPGGMPLYGVRRWRELTVEGQKRRGIKPLKAAATPPDAINPQHYRSRGSEAMQTVDVIENFFVDNAHRSQAFKYLARAGHKNGSDVLEDLEKAKWWIEREMVFITLNG